MAGNISGPGILFVESGITRPDILDEKTFMKWYEEDHIAEIIQTSGMLSARRFKNVDMTVDKPYLSMYPMKDLAFAQGEEFKNIGIQSDILPGTGVCYDVASFRLRFDNLIQVYDPTKKGKGHTNSLITSQIELKDDYDAEDLDKWYREEHLGLLATAKGYLRTTRFKLAFGSGNAQLCALKGLPNTEEPLPEPPTWLAIHEFESEDVDMAALKKLTDTPWTRKVHENRKKAIYNVYKLVRVFGEGDWFYDVEM